MTYEYCSVCDDRHHYGDAFHMTTDAANEQREEAKRFETWMDATRLWWREWSTEQPSACSQAQIGDMMREAFEAGYNTVGANLEDAERRAGEWFSLYSALNAGGEAAPTALNVMGLAPKLYGDKYALGSVLFFVASDVPAGEIHLRDGHDGRLLGKIINVGEYVSAGGKTMTLLERYRTIYSRLWGFKDHCDEQHNITMRELEKELQALRPEAATGWRNPKDRPPNLPGEHHSADVLLSMKRYGDHGIRIGHVSCGHWRPSGGNGNFDDDVLGWMPLPDAGSPQKQEDK